MTGSSSCTYDPDVLSEDEKRRFFTALGDGFGHSRGRKLTEAPLPPEVEPGLLTHRAYYYCEPEEDEFWEYSDGDSPPGLFEECPIDFHFAALREYFNQQRVAYLTYVKALGRYPFEKLTPEEESEWEERRYSDTLYETYSKGWYEYHINQLIFFVEECHETLLRQVKKGGSVLLMLMSITNFSGQLGRLIEQYYWKFLLEKAAIRGAKISESASTGGHVRASKHKTKQALWQTEARSIWKKLPKASKMKVASIIKKRLKVNLSEKHIARTLKYPKTTS
jgi:hypothetical protein